VFPSKTRGVISSRYRIYLWKPRENPIYVSRTVISTKAWGKYRICHEIRYGLGVGGGERTLPTAREFRIFPDNTFSSHETNLTKLFTPRRGYDETYVVLAEIFDNRYVWKYRFHFSNYICPPPNPKNRKRLGRFPSDGSPRA